MSNLLEEARSVINEVDQQMAALFERRMKAVEAVVTYKLEHELAIFDAGREQQVIEKNRACIQDESLVDYYERFLHFMMDLSKEYQREFAAQREAEARD